MTRRLLPLALLAVFVLACDDATTDPESGTESGASAEATFKKTNATGRAAGVEADLISMAREQETRLQARYFNARAVGIQWMGDPEQGQMGGEILFSDRGNKRLPVGWVPGDPRRDGRTNILWSADFPVVPGGLDPVDVTAAVGRAMNTWATGTPCSDLSFVEIPWDSFLWDIFHAGFDSLPPGVLGLTISFAFIDGGGNFTDIDGDGRYDYAFAVILYSSSYPAWGIDVTAFPFVDIESVAFHETGHGLGQAHFGRLSINPAGNVQFAPRAAMNAGYTGLQQSFTGTDLAGHCADWGAWPNN